MPIGLLLLHAQTAPAPSTRAELLIPAALDALVLSCLTKIPSERPAATGDLARQLEAIELSERWTQDQARDWWTRTRM